MARKTAVEGGNGLHSPLDSTASSILPAIRYDARYVEGRCAAVRLRLLRAGLPDRLAAPVPIDLRRVDLRDRGRSGNFHGRARLRLRVSGPPHGREAESPRLLRKTGVSHRALGGRL